MAVPPAVWTGRHAAQERPCPPAGRSAIPVHSRWIGDDGFAEPGREDAEVAMGVRQRKARAAAASCLLGLAGCFLLGGCGSGSGSGGQETLSTAVKDADSAVATARLALDLESSGQLASAAATTTLGDMVKNVNSSRARVQDLSPAAQESRDAREASLDVLNGCVAGILKAQEAVDSTDGRPAAS